MQELPVVDVSGVLREDRAAMESAATTIVHACEEIGFFCITGHGVDESLVDEMQAVSREFFRQPAEIKKSVARPEKAIERGYTSAGGETLAYTLDAKSPPDLKEHFSIGPLSMPDHLNGEAGVLAKANFYPNMWPATPPSMKSVFEEYYRQMGALSGRLQRLFAIGLQMPEDFFVAKFDHHASVLRAHFYPKPSVAPLPGQFRAGMHSDYGILTILKTDTAAGGLQVKHRDGHWIDAVSPDNGFVVNLGDMMKWWTNDRWQSTLHRVVNPPMDAALSERLSTAFFCNPNYDALIECIPTCVPAGERPKYGPVVSGEHRRAKILLSRVHDAATA